MYLVTQIIILLLSIYLSNAGYGVSAPYSDPYEQSDVQAPAYVPSYLKNQRYSGGTKTGYTGTKTGYTGTKTGYSGTKTAYTGTKTGYSGTKTGYSGTKTGYGTKSRYSESKTWYSNNGAVPNYNEFQNNANMPFNPKCEPACKNAGICVDTNTCECPANFHGKFCEFEKKPCLSYPPLPMNSARKCSSDPDDLQTLTPGHFLIGRPLMSLPSPSFSTSESHGPIRDRYKHLEVLRQHFWNRWQLEYIAELQQRVKWRIPDRQLQIGELVLIKEENTPPMNWKLGRILTLYPGKDNVARVADVKTTTGTYRRAIKNLCPLLEPSENLIGADASKAPQDVAASKRNN